jgi:hypothetical protein
MASASVHGADAPASEPQAAAAAVMQALRAAVPQLDGACAVGVVVRAQHRTPQVWHPSCWMRALCVRSLARLHAPVRPTRVSCDTHCCCSCRVQLQGPVWQGRRDGRLPRVHRRPLLRSHVCAARAYGAGVCVVCEGAAWCVDARTPWWLPGARVRCTAPPAHACSRELTPRTRVRVRVRVCVRVRVTNTHRWGATWATCFARRRRRR